MYRVYGVVGLLSQPSRLGIHYTDYMWVMNKHWHAHVWAVTGVYTINFKDACPIGRMTHCRCLCLSKTWMKYTVTPLGTEKHSSVISTHRTQVGTYLSSVCWPWGPPHWWLPLPLRWGPESPSHQIARTMLHHVDWLLVILQLTILAHTYCIIIWHAPVLLHTSAHALLYSAPVECSSKIHHESAILTHCDIGLHIIFHTACNMHGLTGFIMHYTSLYLFPPFPLPSIPSNTMP